MSINKVSEEKRKSILRKSVYALPDNPSEQGFSASDIKGAMFKFITDATDSALAEIDRVIDEVNEQLNLIGASDNLLRKSDLDIIVPQLQSGKISGSQIPGYFDDVIEGDYVNKTTFEVDGESIELERGKIYISNNNGVAYRVSQNGSLVSIGSGLVLGETSETAFDGLRGKLAFEHTQDYGNPHNVTFEQVGAEKRGHAQTILDAHKADSNAHLIYTNHINSTNNPHSVTAEQVGADAVGTAKNEISKHNADDTAHADLRSLLESRVNKFGDTLNGDLNTNNLLPNATDTYNIGSEELRYNKIYSDEMHLTGSATIDKDLHVGGKVVAEGGMVVSVTEEVKTYNDLITLREGAVTGLADGAYTGLKAKLYDGISDGVLVFDKTGTARVGDMGQEQPLATRDESEYMVGNRAIYWDAVAFKLKTSLKNIADLVEFKDLPTSLPASDVYAWAKESTKPTYTIAEIEGQDNLLRITDIALWAKSETKPVYDYSEILNTPTALPASDVALWAKQPTKPTYTYNEILGTPTIPAEQVQADWNETDTTKKSYIKNKPNNNSVSYEVQSLTIQQQAQARKNIGAGTSNFDGQYSSLIGAPTAMPAIDVYDWAKEPTKPTYNYSEIIDAPTKLSDFINDSNLVVDSNYVHTDNNFTNVEQTKLADIDDSLVGVTASDINNIKSITINDGTKVYPDTQKNVALTLELPTQLSDLSDDALHRTVSDAEKNAWSAKIDKLTADELYYSKNGGLINGSVYINGKLQISGDIVQNGDTYITHANEVYSKNDKITLREGAISSLAQGEYAGLIAKLYDGTNDGALVFDSTGTARVGDVGQEQPLATRDESENMADSKFVSWSSAEYKLKTKDITFEDLPNLDTKYLNFTYAGQNLSSEQKGYARASIDAVEKRADILANKQSLYFHSNDEQGLINGNILEVKKKSININGVEHLCIATNTETSTFYAPTSAGVDGQILKSIGTGAPVWVTLGESDIPDLSGLYLTAVPKATSTQVGGLIAQEKTVNETEEVKIDSASGKLYTKTIPTSLPASDVYAWAKASTKPTYTANEVNAMSKDAKVVLFDAQMLTDEQKVQVRANIGAGTSNFDGQYSSLIGTPIIPTDNASLANGAGYITNNALTNYLKFTEQALSNEQKAQARTNIGAGTSNFDGDYNSLTNKLVEATSATSGLLSANNKTKLDGIESGAQKNVIESIALNGSTLPITNKSVNISVPTKTNELTNNGDGISPFATEDYVKGRTSSALRYKNSVNSYDDLPTSGMEVGDMYNIVQAFDAYPAGTNVAWNGSVWDPLGGSVDLSKFYDKTQIDNMVVKYSENQNLAEEYKAIARANIGAIGSSDISTNLSGVVKYNESQSLTSDEKTQACENIGAFYNFDGYGDEILSLNGSLQLHRPFYIKNFTPGVSIVGGGGTLGKECIFEVTYDGVNIYSETSGVVAPTLTLNGDNVVTSHSLNEIINNTTKIANSSGGGSVGNSSLAVQGGAVGNTAHAGNGGAIGLYATTGAGLAGGYKAKAVDSDGNGIDAIQLGTGTNSTAKTLQVYKYQLMNANGYVPSARLHPPTLLWSGTASSGTLTLSQDMSKYRYFILEGLQSTSLGNIITAFVFRNGRTSLQIYLGQNGTSNAYEMAVTISGTSATISKRQNAIIKYIYGIE